MANENNINRQLSNPDFRGLIENNLKNLSNAGTPELGASNRGDQERELGAATERIQTLGEAERLKALPALEESAQRRGVLSGGGTGQALYQESAEIGLREQSLLAGAQENILSRYGGYREAGAGRELTRELTGEQLSSAERIAQLQGATSRDVAGIQGETSRDVAKISGEFGVEASEKSGTGAAAIRAGSAEAILKAEQEFRTTAEGVKDWEASINLGQQTQDFAESSFKRSLAQQIREVNWEQHQRSTEFTETLDQAWEIFDKQYDLAVDENDWKRDMAYDSLWESARQADMNSADQRGQFNRSLAWQKNEFNLSDQRVKEMQTEALDAQWDQTVIQTNADLVSHFSSLRQAASEASANRADQRWIAKETLKLNRSQLEQQGMADESDFFIGIMASPMFSNIEKGQAERIAGDVFDMLEDSGTLTLTDKKNPMFDPDGPDYFYDGTNFLEDGVPVSNFDGIIDSFLKKYQKGNGTDVNATNPTSTTRTQPKTVIGYDHLY